MIIQFSVSNYKSFDCVQTLNFRATTVESSSSSVENRNIVLVDDARYLKVIGLYSANASGKSNLIKDLSFFKEMVTNSVVAEGYSSLNVNPFRQSDTGLERDSYFQIVLLVNGIKYRYGFSIKKNGDI